MSYYEDGVYETPTPEYRPHELKCLGVDPDSDQGLAWSDTCGSCARWQDGVRVGPVLVEDKHGFMCCPVCRGSYGTPPALKGTEDA